jgi:hypothetical protein
MNTKPNASSDSAGLFTTTTQKSPPCRGETMGCDIHVYVEYSDDGEYWQNLTDNAGSRNYVMFGVLAGVRLEHLTVFSPKGLPDGKLGYITEDAHWINVARDGKPEQAEWDGWTSLESAARWVKSKYSEPEYDDSGRIRRVTNPDHHSHSWLNSDELNLALLRYPDAAKGVWGDSGGVQLPHEWVAIRAAMRAIEENGGLARVVFWFDN